MTPLGYMWERTKKNESWKKVYEKLNETQGEQPSRLVHSKGGLLLNLSISPVRASISVVAKGGLGIVIWFSIQSGRRYKGSVEVLRDLVCSEAHLSTKGRLLKSSPGQQIEKTS